MTSAALDDTRISERAQRGAVTSAIPVPTAKASKRWVEQAAKARKDSFFPSHVRHCANNPDRQGRWTLAYWRKSSPLHHTRVAYTCGSYRCPSPECQRAAAHRDFAKIKEAVDSVQNKQGWSLLVLTIDQRETLRKRANGNGWRNEQEAFRELSRMSRNFLARLRRWHKSMGWESFGNRWVATVEVQRNGWPHLNLMIHSPGLARWLREQENPRHELVGELLEHATACDWGTVGYARPAENVDALSGYVVKLAGDFGRKVGEIAKLTQAPTNARMKLRRLRAGKGFIRQLPKNPEYTGIMLRRQNRYGTPGVEPLMEPSQVKCAPEEQEAYLLGVRTAIKAEAVQMADDARVGVEKRLVIVRKVVNYDEGQEAIIGRVRFVGEGVGAGSVGESGRDVSGRGEYFGPLGLTSKRGAAALSRRAWKDLATTGDAARDTRGKSNFVQFASEGVLFTGASRTESTSHGKLIPLSAFRDTISSGGVDPPER